MNMCSNIVELARELGVGRRRFYNWRDRLDEISPPSLRTRKFILCKRITKRKRL